MAVSLTTLPSNSINNIDTNFQRVEEALQDAVSRSGNNPNQMNADLDMNNNDLLNIDKLSVSDLQINGVNPDGIFEQVQDLIDGATIDITGLVEEAETAATAANVSELAAQGYAADAAASADEAELALTFNRVAVQFTTTDAGPYDMGVDNEIGTPNNLDVKIGGVIQDHNTYTVSGTTFTFNDDPGSGLPMEAVLQTNSKQLLVPADGSVTIDSLDSALLDLIDGGTVLENLVFANKYGAVFDDTPEDRALIKQAAMYAIDNNIPFVVPNRGFNWNEGLVIQVPEDVPTIQEAHDAMLNWIFSAYPPRYGDTTQNHIQPVAVTISVSATTHVHNIQNITWTHPHGDLIRLKGRGKTGLTFDSQQAITYLAGVHFVRLRFSNWPSTDPVVGSFLHGLLLSGSGSYQNIEGAWRITAVDSINKDITIAVFARHDTSALVATVAGGTFFHIPCILRFTNQPSSGADVGGIDVHTCLRMSDIGLLGSPSNAGSTNGLVAREHSAILLEQHCSVVEFQRSGLWLLNDAYAQVGYCSFNGNNSGINNLQSVLTGTRTSMQGNAAYNLICGIGSTCSMTISAFGGAGQAGILVNGNASFIGSGHSRRSQFGIDCQPGGFANVNDMNIRSNTEIDVRRRGAGRIVLTVNDSGTFDPPLNTGDTYGGFTAMQSTLAAVT